MGDAASERVGAGHSVAQEADLRHLAELIGAAPVNLVARSERATLFERHVKEAVALSPALPLTPGSRWLDLGTGGGLPGLPLAICHPSVAWVLLDATSKKMALVAQFAQELGLLNVDTVCARAEDAARNPALRGAFYGVVSRAVAQLPTLAELCRGFLGDGGCMAAVKGPAWQDELAAAQPALRALRLRFETAEAVAGAARPTWIVKMRAEGPPPQPYPRRDGLPRRQPLGRPST